MGWGTGIAITSAIFLFSSDIFAEAIRALPPPDTHAPGAVTEEQRAALRRLTLPQGAVSQAVPEVCSPKYQADMHSQAFSRDGATFTALVSDLKQERTLAQVWDVGTGKMLDELSLGHGRGQGSLSPDGQYFVRSTAKNDKVFQEIVRIRDRKVVRRIDAKCSGSQASFSPDFSVYCPQRNGKVQIFDALTGTEKQTLKGFGEGDSFRPPEFSADGSRVAILGPAPDKGVGVVRYTALQVFDVKSGTLLQTFYSPGEKPEDREVGGGNLGFNFFALSPDGKTLAAGGLTHGVQLLDVATGRTQKNIQPENGGHASSVSFSPDGQMLAVGSGNYNLTPDLDVAKNQLHYFRAPEFNEVAKSGIQGGQIRNVAYSPDGTVIASYGDKEDRCRTVFWNAPFLKRKTPHSFDQYLEALGSPDAAGAEEAAWALADPKFQRQVQERLESLGGPPVGAAEAASSRQLMDKALKAGKADVRREAWETLAALASDPNKASWYFKEIEARMPKTNASATFDYKDQLERLKDRLEEKFAAQPWPPRARQIAGLMTALERSGRPGTANALKAYAEKTGLETQATQRATELAGRLRAGLPSPPDFGEGLGNFEPTVPPPGEGELR